MSRHRVRAALPDLGAHDAVARLIRRTMAGAGVRGTVVPFPQWPAGFFTPGAPDDARLVMARTPGGTAGVCLAAPVRGAPGPGALDRTAETDTLVTRLAQATALAAEPLLMYQ